MDRHQRYFKAIVYLICGGYYLCKLLGLMPYTYEYRKDQRQQVRLRTSSPWRIYCSVALVVGVLVLPRVMYELYTRMHFLRQTPLLSFVGFNRYIILQLCALFTIFTQIYNHRDIISCVNRLMHCQQQICHMSSTSTATATLQPRVTMSSHRRIFLLLCSKVLSLAAAMLWTLFVIEHESALQHVPYFSALVFLYYCQLVLQMALNMYLVGILLLTHLAHQLNLLIEQLLRDALCISSSRPLTRLQAQQQRWFATELEQLMRFRARVLRLSRILTRLYSVQPLSFLAFVLSECIVQMFFTYFVAYSDWFRRNMPQPKLSHPRVVTPNPFATASVTAVLWDMSVVIWAMQDMKMQLQATRSVLAEGSLPLCHHQIDTALNGALDHFAIYLRQEQISYFACGLFQLDNRVLFMMAQTILMYLLILIQFDKIFN